VERLNVRHLPSPGEHRRIVFGITAAVTAAVIFAAVL
jgi:hypothetical protein